MMTHSELARRRRQMYRRIRMVLAQRRVDVPATVHLPGSDPDPADAQHRRSGEPTAQH